MKRMLSMVTLLVVLGVWSLDAQEASGQQSGPDVNQQVEIEGEPVPYTPEEFSQWALDLRRFEVITIGVFPLAFIVTRLGYDLGRWGYLSTRQGTPANQYAPWFFAPADKPDFTRREKNGILIASISISGAIALVDYLAGRSESP